MEVDGELPGGTAVVVEDEHPDASRLAVPASTKDDRPSGFGRLLELGADRLDLGRRAGGREMRA